ncbi:uncharacterized protein LOC127746601 [Arachis duranensis]|uniref:Uncharacterized protein LOC127746601 n=1 Tax=Arachis duranensis TaxID=130453 RepID=A0A9C6TH97_ARADU|nr:uncharacterized protein LOC127746601 [Arachis duranensis]
MTRGRPYLKEGALKVMERIFEETKYSTALNGPEGHMPFLRLSPCERGSLEERDRGDIYRGRDLQVLTHQFETPNSGPAIWMKLGRSARFSILFSSTSSACSELLATPPRRASPLSSVLDLLVPISLFEFSLYSRLRALSVSLFLTATCLAARLWSIHRAVTIFPPSPLTADYKRATELEDIIRTKNSTISKLKKDLVVLEQKVMQLTRERRASFTVFYLIFN